jgi:hypothetical protein
LELFLVVLFCDTSCSMDYVWDVFLWKFLIQSSISDTWWFWDAGSKTCLPEVKPGSESWRCAYPSSSRQQCKFT